MVECYGDNLKGFRNGIFVVGDSAGPIHRDDIHPDGPKAHLVFQVFVDVAKEAGGLKHDNPIDIDETIFDRRHHLLGDRALVVTGRGARFFVNFDEGILVLLAIVFNLVDLVRDTKIVVGLFCRTDANIANFTHRLFSPVLLSYVIIILIFLRINNFILAVRKRRLMIDRFRVIFT